MVISDLLPGEGSYLNFRVKCSYLHILSYMQIIKEILRKQLQYDILFRYVNFLTKYLMEENEICT